MAADWQLVMLGAGVGFLGSLAKDIVWVVVSDPLVSRRQFHAQTKMELRAALEEQLAWAEWQLGHTDGPEPFDDVYARFIRMSGGLKRIRDPRLREAAMRHLSAVLVFSGADRSRKSDERTEVLELTAAVRKRMDELRWPK